MAKLDRKDVKIFAENSKETLITEFRTEDSEGLTASFSRDPDVIQNENYSQGWVNDTNNLNTKIYGEDLNAVNYVLSYLLKYLYENGIAEWKSTTTYYQNSICKVDNALYLSLQNNNIGNDPTSTVSYWKLIPLENVSIEDAGSGFSIVKDVTDNVITFKTISVTGYGEITDNGDQLNIDIAGGGGGGGGDTYWGTIRGTITNQTDLISLINLKQDIFTVDSPLVLTDEQHLTINKATSSVSGYLDYQDWNTFNGKQNSLSFSTPLSETSGTVSISKADTSTSGYLDYQDWNTFNNKQNAINGLTITETSTTFDAVPKSSITTSNIGSSTYPISNLFGNVVYSNKLNAGDNNNSYIEFGNDGSDTTYSNGTALAYNAHAFYSGGKHLLSLAYDEAILNTHLFPTVTNTYNLGNSDNIFHEGYFNNTISNTVTTHNISNAYTDVDEIEFLNDSTAGHYVNYNAGTNSTNYGTHVFKSGGGVKFAIFGNMVKSYIDLNPDGSHNLGASNNKWNNVYANNLYGTVQGGCDKNKKENIVERGTEKGETESVLEKLKSLKIYTYNFKNDEEKRTHLGVMAQDLREIEPLLVTNISEKKDEEDLYVDIMGYCALLTESIQKLNEKVEYLEMRIEELEGNKEGELKK